MAQAWEHAEALLRRASKSVKIIRVTGTVLGSLLLGVGQFFKSSAVCAADGPSPCVPAWVVDSAYLAFWLGFITIILTNLVLVFVDRQAVETVSDLHASEAERRHLDRRLADANKTEKALVAWTTLTKLVSEVLDSVLGRDITPQELENAYNFILEAIAERKTRLFGVEDDYLNISIYEWAPARSELVCIACYRSRPSDISKQHRSWRPGEGHVGKAFELQRELICSDATQPDVAAWVAASPAKTKEADRTKYVSLAAFPIGLNAGQPLGVLIMTSDVAGRFRNGGSDGAGAHHGVAALADVASQLAQIMFVIQSRRKAEAEGGRDGA
ncbi:GAF domain-containing protein [Cereibacter sphaeroides]|uniref:GAF domain-containing protein n=1 Tax=Cereibacter sphaeroides TaxID=1063 RepID=UPI0011AE8BC2|nr:GAF domain-containing protein [Cereibacter sphaeroides]